ncbi:MAG: outer membrane beta-barrel family protein, partial [Muribaculaceae bacterium]|nr:outer membrane beta-barrel family protein [Muribaculaceae bacterium]
SMPFRNRAFTFNNNLFLNYSNSIGFINGERNRSGSFMVGESFGIAWRPDNLEFELRPNYNFQTVTNSIQSTNNRSVHTYGGSFYGTYYTPIGIVLNTDLNYSATSGYAQGYDTKTWMWNATVSYQFLRNKAATISLKAYDLLGQRSNVRRSWTANYTMDSRYNSLTRYFMVSFSYKFNTFGKGQEPKVEGSEHRRGPMGPPPGGSGGPMGPPPGR